MWPPAYSSHFSGRFFQQFVDEGLIRLVLFGGEAAELGEQSWGDADGDELLGVTRSGPSDAAGTMQFFVGGFGNVGEINVIIGAAIRHTLFALCGSPVAR